MKAGSGSGAGYASDYEIIIMGYLQATRHPWTCLLFLAPLLAVYEFGVIWLGEQDPNALRNGADSWVRWGLESYGVKQLWAAPLIIVLVFLFRSIWDWKSRPQEPLATVFGMILESIIFAVVLWAAARNFDPLIKQWATLSIADSISVKTPAAAQLVTYIGAGIYEEVLFRLGLFTACFFILRLMLLPKFIAVGMAAVAAAVIFAAAHHVGEHGEAFVPDKFLFRFLAGLIFTALYVFRGFGIAVGAHAGYDILVGVTVQ